jgi:hypothetical protein
MTKIYAWKTGAALALAVAVGYSILTVLFALWPFAGEAFHEAISTGAGFDPNEGRVAWSFGSFAYALALLIIWGFATGALFAWAHTFLHRSDSTR